MRLRFSFRSVLAPSVGVGMVAVALSMQTKVELPVATPEQTVFFETKVRPVLAANCYGCHGQTASSAGLRLDSAAAMAKGSENGRILEPGNPNKSILIRVIKHEGPIKMPMGKKLKPQEIADLVDWVRAGAPWPKESEVAPNKLSAKDRPPLWSLQPIRRPTVPIVKNQSWVRDPIDAFVLSRIEAKKFSPSVEADRRTILKRLTYDLTGLAPTSAEQASFLSDKSTSAYERVVDRLLASPRYGERWARHWLDVARYADTKGYVFVEDRNYPNAYTFRQWVIQSLNQDLPFDQFLIQQLAADLIQPGSEDRSSLAAMGFLTVGRRFLNSVPDIVDDRIDVTTRGMMGFTVACARCHDHKFDPIPTQDYYSLYAVFDSSQESTVAISDKSIRVPWEAYQSEVESTNRERERIIREETKRLRGDQNVSGEVKKTLQALREGDLAMGGALNTLLKSFGATQRDEVRRLEAKLKSLNGNAPARPEFAMAMQEKPNPGDGVVFKRGNPGNRGEVAPRRFLAALTPKGQARESWKNGSGRLELARAIASKENPLTARVIVNRVWMHHFGQGIVRTPSDFGYQGEPPTHPELLDYLAARFMQEGWSLKKLHKWIVMSATYRQSSDASQSVLKSDPENRLFARMNRRRLDLEQMRDSVLQVAGKLDLSAIGGKSVDLWNRPFSNRRSVYGFIERQNLPGLFRTFDFASPDSTNAKRYLTTVPQQALFMMNSPFAIEHSALVASTLPTLTKDEQVKALFQRVLLRNPTPTELANCSKFVSQAQPKSVIDDWSYGQGGVNADGSVEFNPLPVFLQGHYMAGKNMPDSVVGWVQLSALGGHPGNSKRSAAIRRWTSTITGKVNVFGSINHPSELGDGIVAKIISSRKGLLGRWSVRHATVSASIQSIEVQKGDTIDFIVELNESDSYDAFFWSPDIVSVGSNGSWSSRSEFAEPRSGLPPTRLALLAQTLLMSNEFMFID